jgi:hypothetical protein
MESYRHIVVEDLILEHELRIAKLKYYEAFKYPCSNCKGGMWKLISTIRQHLRTMPRDRFLYHSMVGEDPVQGFPPDGLWICTLERMSNMDRMPYNDDPGVEFPDANIEHFMDLEHDIQQQVFDAFNIADETVEEAVRNSQAPPEYDDKVVSIQELEELYKQASVPVWRATETVSSMSLILAEVVIMTMCTTHGVSNAFADELFKFLSSSLLPKYNSLPNSFYHAKNTIQKMGLEYSVIQCCPSRHVLFRGAYEDMDQCPHPGYGLS